MGLDLDYSSLLHVRYPGLVQIHFSTNIDLQTLLDTGCKEFQEHRYRKSAETFLLGWRAKEACREQDIFSKIHWPTERIQHIQDEELLFSDDSNMKDVLLLDTLGLFCLHGAALALYKETDQKKLPIEFSTSRPFDNSGLTTLESLSSEKNSCEKGESIASIADLQDNIGRFIGCTPTPKEATRRIAEYAFILSTIFNMECGKDDLQSDLLWLISETVDDTTWRSKYSNKMKDLLAQRKIN
jgi:hypothetical protein